jgi:hypothetical protein
VGAQRSSAGRSRRVVNPSTSNNNLSVSSLAIVELRIYITNIAWSRWNYDTCMGATLRCEQPIRLNPTLLSHLDSSTHMIESQINCA